MQRDQESERWGDHETPRVSGTRRAAPVAAWQAAGAFAAIHDVTLAELLELYGRKQSSLRLVVDDEPSGEIGLVAGVMAYARYGALEGDAALASMLRADVGAIRTTTSTTTYGEPDHDAHRAAPPRTRPALQHTDARRRARASTPEERSPTRSRGPLDARHATGLPSDDEPTRDLSRELAAIRQRGRLDMGALAVAARGPGHDATRFFTMDRAVVAAALRAVDAVGSARFDDLALGLYVMSGHEPRGLHVAGRTVDVSCLAAVLDALRTSVRAATFELDAGRVHVVGNTVRRAGDAGAVTVLTAVANTSALSVARSLSARFWASFRDALAREDVRSEGVRPGPARKG